MDTFTLSISLTSVLVKQSAQRSNNPAFPFHFLITAVKLYLLRCSCCCCAAGNSFHMLLNLQLQWICCADVIHVRLLFTCCLLPESLHAVKGDLDWLENWETLNLGFSSPGSFSSVFRRTFGRNAT